MNIVKKLKETALVRLYAFLHIPLLWWVRPIMVENSKDRTILKIPLCRRTKNHLGSMYFGALAMGAEAAVAIKAIQTIRSSGKKVDFVFKDFHAEFSKRAEGNVEFTCDQGPQITDLVDKCIQTGQRESATFESYAIVPKKNPNEKVATFKVTLSVKARG